MCGRYVIARAQGDLLGGVPLEEDYADYNVAPTASVPILVDHEEAGQWTRSIHAARWGLLPRWAKEEKFSWKTFNARSETAAQKPTFRHAARAQHCAVPANGYYEWLKRQSPDSGKAAKTPYYVHPAEESQNIYFAGLYDWWKVPEGPDAGQWLLSATILTMDSPTEADALLAETGGDTLAELGRLHDRLPIPLGQDGTEGDALTAWLRAGSEEDPAAAIDTVRHQAYATAASWRLREVGPEVGSVAHHGPELIRPAQTLL